MRPEGAHLENGIAIIHSNQLEGLRDVVEYWLRQHPLHPLENEVFLVQSNGMGQWLKQSLAQNTALGIAAAVQVQLPSMFIWNVYRAILGQQIPKQQPLAKAPLTWRLFRLLPGLMTHPSFERLADFLQQDLNSRKQFQLAEQLADLYDQYQVYRSDWINDWAGNRDVLRNASGETQPLPQQQKWQAHLWREVLQDLAPECRTFASRASVHTQFMAQIGELNRRPAGIPRRVVLFGLSSLPQQSLEVIAKLDRFCQIVLCVHNPCRHYWADIVEDKELLKALRKRHSYKPGMHSELTPDQLHLQANPLLAAWGKQGRDYIRLLDHFDDTQAYADWHWPDHKIDLFQDYGSDQQRCLLQKIQQSILDLEPIPAEPISTGDADDSIAFNIAHSPQREVEILHDQLLARFNGTANTGNPLTPRDVIVMVPDINQYAPHIRAVFGQIQTDDPRYIPFSLADQQQRGENPFLVALQLLLNLPESRFSVSECLGLLDVPAVRQRFGIDEAAMPKLHQWLEQAGVRWGLNAKHRTRKVDMPADFAGNTWQFGLRRMLLGYAVGSGKAFNGIEPYDEIGGLEAQWLGHLCHLLDTLADYADKLNIDKNADTWLQTLTCLLEDFFIADNDRDRKILETLSRALSDWNQDCSLGGLGVNDLLPLHVVREAWLTAVDTPNLQQRFLGGNVNFCTLMPMRAIPFRLICLLGMNDGDYPRSHYPHSFDLMNQRGQYRPGDRSRRQDDQYLFLEALLSAREQLYISWVGRSIRDNSERPASVLISQLRDFIEQSWCLSNGQNLLDLLTLVHPLQPFSLEYIKKERDPRLFTYAREWYQIAQTDIAQPAKDFIRTEQAYQLTAETLSVFMRAPVKAYCQQSLQFSFNSADVTSEDEEPFAFDRLQAQLASNALLDGLKAQASRDTHAFFEQQRKSLSGQGKLPLGGFAETAFAGIAKPVEQAWGRYQNLLPDWPLELPAQHVTMSVLSSEGIAMTLSAGLNHLRQQAAGYYALFTLTAQTLFKKENIQHHKLLLPWIQHLSACADGLSVTSYIIGSDGVVEIPALDRADAKGYIANLLEAWLQGLQSPLPVACRTAFVWLNSDDEKALEAAQAQYEGDDWNNGEVHYDAYLARFFPTFASFNTTEHANFPVWCERLYQPVYNQLKIKP